jgi:hypothetical protein
MFGIYSKVVLSSSILVYLKSNPLVALRIPPGFVIHLDLGEPETVEGLGMVNHAYINSQNTHNRIVQVAILITKESLDSVRGFPKADV